MASEGSDRCKKKNKKTFFHETRRNTVNFSQSMETQMVHDENDCTRLKQKDGQLPVSQLETEMASNRSDCLTAEQKDGF